jgi:hypothetical protein
LQSRAFSTATGTTSTWTPKAQSFNVSQLKNGIKVATAENNNGVASVGVFINTGSRFETPQTLGATGVVKRLGFKVSLLLHKETIFLARYWTRELQICLQQIFIGHQIYLSLLNNYWSRRYLFMANNFSFLDRAPRIFLN